ncbi:aldehyde dehydrogenase family protein [Sphingosinicella microcystinivorans]|nr:aldehyde dehydrogenase family protein [Sphingosinicella microcystinivorans]
MELQPLADGTLRRFSERLPVVDPALGTVVAEAPAANIDEIEDAVSEAAKGFATWRQIPIEERRAYLGRFADALAAAVERIAPVLTREQGKPVADATREVLGSAYFIRQLAGIDLKPVVLRDDEQERIEAHYDPLGVALGITAWNFPLLLSAWKLAPALLAGNSIILKPSPNTPLAVLMMDEVAETILPRGVLQVVPCADVLAPRLVEHPLIRKVSFTGSTRSGGAVASAAASAIKRVTLELGGNDAAILLDDVSVDAIAPALFQARFANAGQVCSALKRLYVPRALEAAVVEALVREAGQVAMGPGSDPASTMGPVQNARQKAELEAMIEDAVRLGAQVAYRGSAPETGCFVPVTILTGVPGDARILKEEAFGPVMPVIAYDDVADALAAANESPFGLGGSVWSGDVEKAKALALGFETGTVWINRHPAISPEIPFGGAKMSGVGVEFGAEGLKEFAQRKIVSVAKAS